MYPIAYPVLMIEPGEDTGAFRGFGLIREPESNSAESSRNNHHKATK